MITLASTPKLWSNGRYKMELEGKSTDEAPVKTFEDLPIANASTLLLIDTQDVKFYDEESDAWV